MISPYHQPLQMLEIRTNPDGRCTLRMLRRYINILSIGNAVVHNYE